MRIAITPGEPAGVGPEILVRLAQENSFQLPEGENLELVAIGSRDLLEETAARLSLPLELNPFEPSIPVGSRAKQLSFVDIALKAPAQPGELTHVNSAYVLETLQTAASLCSQHKTDALVTGPVHKGVINDAGHQFSGHTEFFAEHAACEKVVMMLATEGLRVALVTTHLPLKDVPAAITRQELARTLHILSSDLETQFGISAPKILVCGLNPHAGENGHMGTEEIEVIAPVLDMLRKQGMNVEGPLPADTLFTPKYLDNADAVLAMYHDQGLPVLKYKGFGNAVNITLGLPYIRTSVDHGTALDIAGQGLADTGSLKTAIQYAIDMVTAKSNKR